jgi:type IV fimbrial biogenesis protein FimT
MRARGFSLVELMTVLAIAAILLGIGVPGFRSLIQNQRVIAATNDFFAAINLARSEAMQRGARVDLVPADGKNWNNGWVIFIDGNDDQMPEAGETLVFAHGPVTDGLTITSSFTDSSKKYLAYNASGRSRTNSSSFSPQLGTVSLALDRHVRRIKINFLGRPRVCDPSHDSACTGTADAK